MPLWHVGRRRSRIPQFVDPGELEALGGCKPTDTDHTAEKKHGRLPLLAFDAPRETTRSPTLRTGQNNWPHVAKACASLCCGTPKRTEARALCLSKESKGAVPKRIFSWDRQPQLVLLQGLATIKPGFVGLAHAE